MFPPLSFKEDVIALLTSPFFVVYPVKVFWSNLLTPLIVPIQRFPWLSSEMEVTKWLSNPSFGE